MTWTRNPFIHVIIDDAVLLRRWTGDVYPTTRITPEIFEIWTSLAKSIRIALRRGSYLVIDPSKIDLMAIGLQYYLVWIHYVNSIFNVSCLASFNSYWDYFCFVICSRFGFIYSMLLFMWKFDGHSSKKSSIYPYLAKDISCHLPCSCFDSHCVRF